ncbi:MAG: urease accessory protein UreD [Pseudomonadota bacterium]
MQLAATPPRLPRAIGTSRIVLRRRERRTVLDELYQQGCAKVRFPRGEIDAAHESVLINTAGGLTDGDRLDQHVHWQARTRGVITTQAAERIYRSRGAAATVESRLQVDADASAIWLPQETIVFDGGRLQRGLHATLQPGATLFASESVVFGRTAMGECVRQGALADAWHIERDGQPLFIDRFAIDDVVDGDLSQWRAQPVTMAGGLAMMTIVIVATELAQYVEPARAALEACNVHAGVSNLGAVLLMRVVSDDASALRDTLQRLFFCIQSVAAADNPLRGVAMPRAYFC